MKLRASLLHRHALLGSIALALLIVLPVQAQPQRPPAAAIASAHPLATAAGEEILAAGGNAFDAAIAVSAALAVVEPFGSGIGGGGFWLLHRAEDDYQVFVDARETAPAAAHADMYVGEDGKVDSQASLVGPLAAAIPGTPAALAHLAEYYGRLPLARSLAPAIRLAREGFPVDDRYRRLARWRLQDLRRYPATRAIFLHEGAPPPAGHLLRQPELADTLTALATHGAAGFYEGEIAQRLVESVRRHGGIWTLEDLRDYRVIEREPLIGEYRGVRIVTAPPPSAGGISMLTMLNILAGYDLDALPPDGRAHVIVEAMRRAYRDRAEYLGDPEFVEMPLQRLISPHYAAGLRASLRFDRATPSESLREVTLADSRGESTTHFSILDSEGNRVAATLSINYAFGSGFTAEGTGVLLNNEMDDFAPQPGTPNAYGLVGSSANAIAPGKRPLSSMTPTFLEASDRIGILGTPGGSRIVSMVLLGTLDFAAGEPAETWVSRPRFHHQYLPDEIEHEPDALEGAREGLRRRGHRLKDLQREYGDMQAILWTFDGVVQAASDPRGGGLARVISLPKRTSRPRALSSTVQPD